MTEPVHDPAYWRRRLALARKMGELHRSIFHCQRDRWERIEGKHREILAATLRDHVTVLDVGCGYGRLLTLMPPGWRGYYLGIDLSPDFITLARELHPHHPHPDGPVPGFGTFDVSKTSAAYRLATAHPALAPLDAYRSSTLWDWAVLISFRPMIKRNQGDEVWERMEANIKAVSINQLYLEYDPDCNGFVE